MILIGFALEGRAVTGARRGSRTRPGWPGRLGWCCAVLVGLVAGAGAAVSPAHAGRLLLVHEGMVRVVGPRGRVRTLVFARSPSGVGRFALNDSHRVLFLDRRPGSRAMGPDRIQVRDLGTGRFGQFPFYTKRVRHNRIIRLLRLLPGASGIAYLKLDRYRAVPCTAWRRRCRDLGSVRRFRGRITAVTVLPDGQHLVVHHPGFTRANERRFRVRGYGNYLRGKPQTLYYGRTWGGPLRRLVRRRAFEWVRLVDSGRFAVYLVPGAASARVRRYELRSLEVSTGKETILTRIDLPRRRHGSAPPEVLAFLRSPDLVLSRSGGLWRLVAGRRGSVPLALPAGFQRLPLLDSLAGPHTTLSPYLVIYRWRGRVSARRFRYEVRVVRVVDARVVLTHTLVGASPSAGAYLP